MLPNPTGHNLWNNQPSSRICVSKAWALTQKQAAHGHLQSPAGVDRSAPWHFQTSSRPANVLARLGSGKCRG